jgi:C1A family cysteine protease/PKD repeat protein
MGSSGFAAAIAENPEVPQNNTSCAESTIETAPINPDFQEPGEPDPIDLISFVDDHIYVSGAGYKPSPVDLSGLKRTGNKLMVGAPGTEIPTAYDLRKEGKLTAVGNQGIIGSCWAFSSIASLESYLLGTEGKSYDFSENNMKNLASKNYPNGFDLTPEDGGNEFISAAYLSRWNGPVNESEDPYSDLSDYSPTGLSVQKHVQDILFLPVRKGSLDNEVIKRALMEYGAVSSTMYWDQAYYQEQTNTYRCTTSLTANHAITLVGWNDSFDRNLFSQVPPGDGAFLVKNSWGENWGEGGYFYISYYDSKLGYDENAVFTAEKKDNYDYIYQYDPMGWVISKEYAGSLVAWGSNIFSSGRDETLRAVGFYTTDLNTAYEIYVYKNPVNGPLNSRRIYATKETGTYSLPGYHTHELKSPVSLSPGEKYSVVIKFSNPSAGGTLAVEQPITFYSSKAQANSGESYVSQNGISWEDISDSSEANLCIKAFTTTDELPEANFSSNTIGGNYPITVQFTDLSKNAFSWEWDLNGDGQIDSTAQNTTYTYNAYGNYNISLKVSNRNGIDSETKFDYVTVASLSITSANPEGTITTYQGDMQAFNINTDQTCTISWYLNGELKSSESRVKSSEYSNSSLSPGVYNLTAIAEFGNEKVMYSWNWIVMDWNPWDNSASKEGENVSTAELQEAIHIYLNELHLSETGAKITGERLKDLIRLWKESPSE